LIYDVSNQSVLTIPMYGTNALNLVRYIFFHLWTDMQKTAATASSLALVRDPTVEIVGADVDGLAVHRTPHLS
jgi:hypothetical protein